jgi:hypothetical protein
MAHPQTKMKLEKKARKQKQVEAIVKQIELEEFNCTVLSIAEWNEHWNMWTTTTTINS